MIFFFLIFENVHYIIVFSRCQIRVQESARMQDFAPFTQELKGALSGPDPQPYSNCALLINPLHGLKGHFMLWSATRLRNLATY
jgi:hypothetical protein